MRVRDTPQPHEVVGRNRQHFVARRVLGGLDGLRIERQLRIVAHRRQTQPDQAEELAQIAARTQRKMVERAGGEELVPGGVTALDHVAQHLQAGRVGFAAAVFEDVRAHQPAR